MRAIRRLIVLCGVLLPLTAWADLPFLTDNTETQDKGKFQLEIGGEYDRDRETFDGATVNEIDYFLTPTLTYGMSKTVDVFGSLPYQWSSVKTEGDPFPNRISGVNDALLGLKWRFYGKEDLSFGIRPLVTLPAGDYKKTLGTGKVDYGAYLMMTKKLDPWEFDVNWGYSRNENKIGERKNLWHVSGLVSYEIVEDLKMGADIGINTDTDKTSEIEPGYVLAGVIYSVSEQLELSFGIQKAFTPATDWAIRPGVTCRF